MKQILPFLFFLLLCNCIVYGQDPGNTSIPDKKLTTFFNPVRQWKSKFKYGYNFHYGLSIVSNMNGKIGVIDTNGREIIPLTHNINEIKIYYPNRIAVKTNSKWGIADTNNRIVVPLEFDEVYVLPNGNIRVNVGAKYGLFSSNGQEILPAKYDNILGGSFHSNRIIAMKDSKYGCVDTSGKIIISFVYDEIFGFWKGISGVKKNDCWGYIDSNGIELTPIQYDETGNFSDSLGRIYSNGKTGYVGRNGKEVIPLDYNQLQDFRCGRIAALKDKKWGFIDKNNKVVIPFIYDEVTNFSKDGVAKVFKFHGKKHGREGLIDTMGNELLHVKYTFLGHYDRERAYIREKPFGKSKYINLRTGVITQLPYSWIGFFYTNRAVAEIGNKMGFINLNGNVVIPIKYNYFTDRDTGKYIGAQLEKDGKWGLIDTNGNEIIPFVYDKISGVVSDGLLPACQGGKWGYIDLQNNVQIPFIFNNVQPFKNGVAKVYFGNETCRINKRGRCIDNCK